MRTLPVGLTPSQGEFTFPWPLISVALIVGIIPVVPLIIVVQQRITALLPGRGVEGRSSAAFAEGLTLSSADRIWRHLANYLRALGGQAATREWPARHLLFSHVLDDLVGSAVQHQSLYRADLPVTPVHARGTVEWSALLPFGAAWSHVFSGTTYAGGRRINVPRADRATLGVLPRGFAGSGSYSVPCGIDPAKPSDQSYPHGRIRSPHSAR